MSDGLAAFRAAYEAALASFHADARGGTLLAALPASGWNRGGSMAFATVLAERLRGELVSIGWYELLADRVAVSVHGILLDSEGAYCESEIVAKYSALARAPLALWPITSATVTPLSGDRAFRAALAALLEPYLESVAAYFEALSQQSA